MIIMGEYFYNSYSDPLLYFEEAINRCLISRKSFWSTSKVLILN